MLYIILTEQYLNASYDKIIQLYRSVYVTVRYAHTNSSVTKSTNSSAALHARTML